MNFNHLFLIAPTSLQSLTPVEVQAIHGVAANFTNGPIDPMMSAVRRSDETFDVDLTFTWSWNGKRMNSQCNLLNRLLREFWENQLPPLHAHFDHWQVVLNLGTQTKVKLVRDCLDYVWQGQTPESWKKTQGME